MASEDIEGLRLQEEGEEGFNFDIDEDGEEAGDLRWCLVGRFLCDKPIHVRSMKARIADLWRPVKGVNIKQANDGLFLFHFAHHLDMEATLKGEPWMFDTHLLIIEKVKLEVQIKDTSLFHAEFWAQGHNFLAVLMSEKVGRSLASFVGSFVEYDKHNNTSFWRQYMKPLKRHTKVKNKGGDWCTVIFKYKKLELLCFVCGLLGHSEQKCKFIFAMQNDDDVRGWSGKLRADNMRYGGGPASRWLREESTGGSQQSFHEKFHYCRRWKPTTHHKGPTK